MSEKTIALSVVQQKAVTIKDFIHKKGIVDQLEAALPRFLNADRFLRTIYSALLQNPKLLDCSQDSLLSSMIQAAQLGLEPVLGKAALIPYGNEMQFQPMYRGLIDLALRSDKIDKITAHTVFDKDTFTIEYGTDEKLAHKPFLDGDRGNIRGSYTVWYYKDGGTTHSYMSVSDIYKIRDRSAAWKAYLQYKKTCPWNTDESEMCKKTVIKRHSKLQPCSVEFEKAVEYDNALETGASIITNAKDLPPGKQRKTPDYTPKDLNEKVEEMEKNLDEGEGPEVIILPDENKPTVDPLTGDNLEQGEPQGILPDGTDPKEWMVACRPSSSVSNAKAFIAVYEEQKEVIAAMTDTKIKAQLKKKLEKTKNYLKQIEGNKRDIAEAKEAGLVGTAEEHSPISKEDQIPAFEQKQNNQEPEYDAIGRKKFLDAMKGYLNENHEKYGAVLNDNSTPEKPLNGMNDVEVSDQGVILGFMKIEFDKE